MSVTHETTTEWYGRRRSDGALFALLDELSHELGTPLTSVQNNLALVRSAVSRATEGGTVLAAVDERSSEAAKSTERVVELVRALREGLGRLAGNKLVLRPLEDVVEEEMGVLSEELAEDVSIELRLLPTTPRPLDPRAIARLLRHLVDNATQASTPGGRIVVSVLPAGEGAELVVEDEGTGIPADVGDAIYRPFFTTRPGAKGLGLTFARALVDAHGGDLWHEVPAGGGARFRAWFPAWAGEERAPFPVAPSLDGRHGAPLPLTTWT